MVYGESSLTRRSCVFAAIVALPALTGVLAAMLSTESSATDSLTSIDQGFRVEVVDQGSDCCPRTVTIQVQAAGGGTPRQTLHLSGRLATVDSVRIVGDQRVLLEGQLPWGGSNLLIGDLRTLQQEESIWAYGFNISPSGRFLAYGTHYPRGIVPPTARRSIYLLYDLTRGPDTNRPSLHQEWPEASSGRPIFPEKNAEDPSWNIMADSESYYLHSPFLWTEDEHRIVFLAGTSGASPTGIACYIVRVDLNEAWEPRSIVKEELTPENVDLSGHTVPLEYILDEPLCIPTEKLTWTHEGRYDEVTAAADPARQLGPKVRIRVP